MWDERRWKDMFNDDELVVDKDKNNIEEDDNFDNDMDNHDIEIDNEPSGEEIMNYTDNFALFKRAYQLANNDISKHTELYTLLSNFVIENEINHSDNRQVIKNRKEGESVIV